MSAKGQLLTPTNWTSFAAFCYLTAINVYLVALFSSTVFLACIISQFDSAHNSTSHRKTDHH